MESQNDPGIFIFFEMSGMRMSLLKLYFSQIYESHILIV